MFKNSGNLGYNFWHNSTMSKRGVGILISSNLNVDVLNIFKDDHCNVLGLLVEIDRVKLLLISVYGPNNNDDNFFDFLARYIGDNSTVPTICGGDWNLTYSTDPTNFNIDLINMNAPPSIYRSKKLLNLCENFHLIDPFRALYPSRREYTYVPRAGMNNRSRIDFFIISDSLINLIDDCGIKNSLLTKLFDHKCVTLALNKEKQPVNVHRIDPCIFKHPRFDAVVACTVVESYLQHAAPEQDGLDLDAGLRAIGDLVSTIRAINGV
jgi:exonuclease III